MVEICDVSRGEWAGVKEALGCRGFSGGEARERGLAKVQKL